MGYERKWIDDLEDPCIDWRMALPMLLAAIVFTWLIFFG